MSKDKWESAYLMDELSSCLPVEPSFRKRALLVLGCADQSRIINRELQSAFTRLEEAINCSMKRFECEDWESRMFSLKLSAIRDQNFEVAAHARMLQMAFSPRPDFRTVNLHFETHESDEKRHDEKVNQRVCFLLRDIFSNPFRPVTLDPRWLSSTVRDLAQVIYDARVFDRMPILGDALLDAGCDSDEIIKHCQGPGPHVRGSWVVDLLTGRK